MDKEEDFTRNQHKLSAGMVTRDLGVVYVSRDPLICAQFKRSTSSILQINKKGSPKTISLEKYTAAFGVTANILIVKLAQIVPAILT